MSSAPARSNSNFLHECDALGIEWRDPPPPAPRPTLYDPVLKLLDERPGVWAMVRKFGALRPARETCYRLRKRHPEYDFHAARAGHDPARGELFARRRPAGTERARRRDAAAQSNEVR